ncbi:MAG: hypothetical protein ACREIC_34525, partial [Limisphaerales bacterium]
PLPREEGRGENSTNPARSRIEPNELRFAEIVLVLLLVLVLDLLGFRGRGGGRSSRFMGRGIAFGLPRDGFGSSPRPPSGVCFFSLTTQGRAAIQGAATFQRGMINQRHCPFCGSPAIDECAHLALAVEARDFVRRCIESCHGQGPWHTICQARREDFIWLETAFCDEFLRGLRWFGAMDHEWRSGPKHEQGGFWVLLWSNNPQQLWWELREELERKIVAPPTSAETPPWLIWMTPR